MCLMTEFRKTNVVLFYKAWNNGTKKLEGFIFFNASNPYFFRNQLIWNLINDILDNYRCNGIIVLHSSIGSNFPEQFIRSYGRIIPAVKFQYEVSSASQISPVFHDCLFTPSNITASYEAYSPTIADKSLSLSLCGLVKPSDRCERTSFS
ncbi:hypothetical protein V1477_005727 [Vespula maculifrons]|uniref:Uncharacterized protein n=1 Tax=Vespula maculifrons TaxID=7453 RepID=A0ABD2CLU9_VESMC